MDAYDNFGNQISVTQSQGNFLSSYDAYGNNVSGLQGVNTLAGLPILGTPASNPITLANVTSSQNYNELTVQKLIIGGGKEITITPADDIQQNLDAINAAGGGTLRLSAGTYLPQAGITGYSNVQIIGEDSTTTTVDFGSANRSLTYSGTSVYTTGTITVASGVNITGSGTSWLANVTAGQNLFLGTRWYTIAAVTSDTTLILAEAYGDTVTLPSSYRIATVITGVVLQDITFKNATGTALSFTDTKDIELIRLTLVSNNVGIAMTNVSRGKFDQITVVSSTSDGTQMTNCGLFNITAWLCAGNGGNGFTLNNVKTVPFSFSSSTSNTGDGFNCTTVVDCVFKVEASLNSGQGIEFVSGCTNNFINDAQCRNNTSDGIKFTASSNNNVIGPVTLSSNGGYGINIAASSDNTNLILAPNFISNSSGTYTDSGTGTVIIRKGVIATQFAKGSGTGTDYTITSFSSYADLDSTNLTITLSLDSGTPLLIKAYAKIHVTTNVNQTSAIKLKDITNGVDIGEFVNWANVAVATTDSEAQMETVYIPSAYPCTIRMQALNQSSSNPCVVRNGAFSPNLILDGNANNRSATTLSGTTPWIIIQPLPLS